MGIAIPGKNGLHIETGPWSSVNAVSTAGIVTPQKCSDHIDSVSKGWDYPFHLANKRIKLGRFLTEEYYPGLSPINQCHINKRTFSS